MTQTAGPWRVIGPAGKANPNMGFWSVEGETHVASDLTQDDAALIAAAPDLLEALRDIIGDNEFGCTRPAYLKARAAIAKAGGPVMTIKILFDAPVISR